MKYEQYIDDVLNDRIVVGELMRLSVQRFQQLRTQYVFKPKKVQKVLDFFKLLRHFKGKTSGRIFALEAWQEFIVAYLFGLYNEDGTRLVRNAYIEMARKQGKTAFAAGLALYCAFADGEPGAEVDLAANSKEQAKIAYEFCEAYAAQLDPRGTQLSRYRDRINDKRTKSKLQVFAADDTKLDGFDASMYLLDEYHAAKNSKLRDVLQSSQGTRKNPLGIIITTAGFDKLGVCYQYRTMCCEVLHGVAKSDSLAAFVYSLDDEDDWADPSVWAKSNPNLGVTVQPAFIEGEVADAKNMPSAEVGVRTKTINQWCESSDVWIPDHYILDSTQLFKPSDYPDIDWYGGIDLSATTDLAAFALVGRDEERGKVYMWTKYYLPAESLKENRFKELYGDWYRRGWLTLTPGNVTDYDIILDDIRKMDDEVNIIKIAYDSWNSTQFVVNAELAGLPMEAFSQTLGNFNRPTKELERLMLSGKIVLDSNGINRHCFRNVALAVDRNGNTKPTKQFQEKKIDGVIAMLEGLGLLVSNTGGTGFWV